jgi:hypothetical protein
LYFTESFGITAKGYCFIPSTSVSLERLCSKLSQPLYFSHVPRWFLLAGFFCPGDFDREISPWTSCPGDLALAILSWRSCHGDLAIEICHRDVTLGIHHGDMP